MSDSEGLQRWQSPQWGWAERHGVVLDSGSLVERFLGRTKRVHVADVVEVYVARPPGLYPGLCVHVRDVRGTVTVFHSLSVDVFYPSGGSQHAKLIEIADEIARVPRRRD